MRLLFLLPSVPDPPDSGARIRNIGLIEVAKERHEVHAIAFGDARQAGALQALVEHGTVVPPPSPPGPVSRLAGMVASPLPDLAERLWSDSFSDVLRQMLSTSRYDAVQAEGLEMARHLAPARQVGVRTVYDAHNAEYLIQRRAAELDGHHEGWHPRSFQGAGPRVYSFLQAARLARYEAEVVRSSSLVLAVSNHDANQLEALVPEAPPVHVVPNAIDLARFPMRSMPPEEPHALLFLGKLDYRPNREAVRWLLGEVMPGVFQHVPASRLYVVGANPPGWLVRAGQSDSRIAVVGPVEDERPYLQRASAMVLPLRVGGGSRLKALVAMASGTPVVSTAMGMEGLDAEAGRDFVRADSAEQWGAELCTLLLGAPRPEEMVERARALVERRYTWRALGPRLHAAYEALARS